MVIYAKPLGLFRVGGVQRPQCISLSLSVIFKETHLGIGHKFSEMNKEICPGFKQRIKQLFFILVEIKMQYELCSNTSPCFQQNFVHMPDRTKPKKGSRAEQAPNVLTFFVQLYLVIHVSSNQLRLAQFMQSALQSSFDNRSRS